VQLSIPHLCKKRRNNVRETMNLCVGRERKRDEVRGKRERKTVKNREIEEEGEREERRKER